MTVQKIIIFTMQLCRHHDMFWRFLLLLFCFYFALLVYYAVVKFLKLARYANKYTLHNFSSKNYRNVSDTFKINRIIVGTSIV